MDPADLEGLRQATTSQAEVVKHHETTLLQVMDHVQQLTTSVAQLGAQLKAVRDQLASTSRTPSTHQPSRDGTMGDMGTCAQFLHQCSLVLAQQPSTYTSLKSPLL